VTAGVTVMRGSKKEVRSFLVIRKDMALAGYVDELFYVYC